MAVSRMLASITTVTTLNLYSVAGKNNDCVCLGMPIALCDELVMVRNYPCYALIVKQLYSVLCVVIMIDSPSCTNVFSL